MKKINYIKIIKLILMLLFAIVTIVNYTKGDWSQFIVGVTMLVILRHEVFVRDR
jgi:hypothetical protein